jgi:hypothetical protein
MSAPREITPNKLAALPFGFLDPHWIHQDPPYSDYIEATWNTFSVWSNLPTGPWHWNADDKELTDGDWESFYPGYYLIDVTTNSIHELSGSYQDKLVKYNANTERWEYLDHKPVQFPSLEPDDPDDTEVTALLDSATASISHSRLALTPEQQKQSLPGGLPVTPSKPPTVTPVPPPAPVKLSTRTATSSKNLSTPDPALIKPLVMASSSTTAVSTKSLGSAPEPFDGTSANAEAFWTNLANYYFLNQDLHSTTSKRIASALTHFKLGTSAGEWAKDRQQAALANSPPDFGSWQDFQDAFKAHFIPVDQKLLSTQLLHTMKMGNKPFFEWYQEWSTHANRSGANDETKMYAFRQNIPAALHQKIIGVSPPPTTLTRLVELAKEFDQMWRMYNTPRTSSSNSFFNRRQPNVRSTNSDEQEDPAIALAGFPPNSPKFTKLSQDEKDH